MLLLDADPAPLVDTDLLCPGHVPVPEDGGEHNAADHVQQLLRGGGAPGERRCEAILE